MYRDWTLKASAALAAALQVHHLSKYSTCPSEYCSDITQETLTAFNQTKDEPQHALFNAIPCGPVNFDTGFVLCGLNVVSSRWVDWKSFTLYHTASHLNPKLTLPNGELAYCHGYIMGTLWDGEGGLAEKWTGVRVFVVDADLKIEGSDRSCNFLLNPDSFTDKNTRAGKLQFADSIHRTCS